MKCPNCPESTLVMTDRQGIEIDYCPTCRGIWLDRGELDKLLDRAGSVQVTTQMPISQNRGRGDFDDSDFRGRQGFQRDRKKSWLNEIFD